MQTGGKFKETSQTKSTDPIYRITFFLKMNKMCESVPLTLVMQITLT